MKASKAKSPLTMYIAETDHGDMSYSSLLKQVIEDCDSKGLNVKVFSEFGNKNKDIKSQDEKLMTQANNLSNVPDPKLHEATTKFLNERSIPMGNLFERFTKLIPAALAGLPENLTPEEIFERRKPFIDNPETIKLLEAEIAIREKNEAEGLGEVSDRNSAESGNDFRRYENAFVQKPAHQAMAQDVINGVSGNEDVIIMIAGAPHIYGLNQELGAKFRDSQKLVVGNFQEAQVDFNDINSVRSAHFSSGKESCLAVGNLVEFAIDADKQAVVPAEVNAAVLAAKLDLQKSEEEKDKTPTREVEEVKTETKDGVETTKAILADGDEEVIDKKPASAAATNDKRPPFLQQIFDKHDNPALDHQSGSEGHSH
jgi:hypothetical protein